MDKRYLLILVLIIICCINLSFIANHSDIIGSASANAGNYLFTVPEGCELQQSTGNMAKIQNYNHIKINFENNISDDNYEKHLNYIKNASDEKILSKGTLTVDNITVQSVYSQTTDKKNESVFYFEKDNIPFKITITNFNYDNDYNLTLDYATFIIQTAHFDYKSI